MSAQAVSKWERGENAPDGPTTEATVMFTDLKGFVKRVRDLSASDMARHRRMLRSHWAQQVNAGSSVTFCRRGSAGLRYPHV